MYITYPKNSYIYRGSDLKLENSFKTPYKPIWFTSSIEYACMYANTKSKVVKSFILLKDLLLLDVSKIDILKLNNKKNIRIGKENISLQELYKIIFGKDHIKGKKNISIEDLKNNKYPDIQLTKFYNLTKQLGRGEKTLKWYEKICMKNKKISKKNNFNRLSDGGLDFIFLKNLKKFFPTIDGYYAPHIDSEWSMINCEQEVEEIDKDKLCTFYQFQELAILSFKKLSLQKNYKSSICKKMLS